jgi:hypothetical protein
MSILRQPIGNDFENRIGAKGVVIILIFVAGDDAKDSHAGHFEVGMIDASGITRIVQGVCELLREANAMIELSEEEQPRIGGERFVGDFELEGS